MKIDWQKMNGLIPAIVQHAESGRILMLAYMNEASLAKTLETGQVTFFSRSRQELWTKGETSGNRLEFVSVKTDCDGDALLIQARALGPVCHTGTETCFGSDEGVATLGFLGKLSRVIDQRFAASDEKSSYVAKLVAAGTDRMAQKVGEEAVETVIASKNEDLAAFENEAADLIFHLMVLLKAKGTSLEKLTQVLAARHSAG